MKKLFFAILTVAAITVTVPAFAVVNGGLSTWGQVSGSGFLSQETTHQAYAGFIIGTYQGATMATWGGNASAQQMTGYTHVDDITIVDTYTGASATSPWYGEASVSASMETQMTNPDAFVGITNDVNLLTIGQGSAYIDQYTSVVTH